MKKSIKEKGQSAGNYKKKMLSGYNSKLLNFIGSSETIREVSFNFDLFIKNSVLHKKKLIRRELEWVIGFTEGDGSFIVSKNRNFFILTQKSCITLYKIKKFLGFGSVTKAGNYFRYIVANNENVFKLICLFNGNLLLKKTNERFKLWLNNYNNLNKTNIEYICGPTVEQYKNNRWLSGFIDAEGCFYALLRKERLISLRLSLFLDQKGELDVLKQIAQEFGGYVVIRSKKNTQVNLDNARLEAERINVIREANEEYYRAVLSSKESRIQIIRYLSSYSLLGDKQISYLRWKRLNESDLQKMNRKKIENLCKNINKR